MTKSRLEFAKEFWHAIGISEALRTHGKVTDPGHGESAFRALWRPEHSDPEVTRAHCLTFFQGGFTAGGKVLTAGREMPIEEVKALLLGEID